MKLNKAIDKKLKREVNKWKETARESGGSELLEAEPEETEEFTETYQNQQIELLDMEVHDLVKEVKNTGQVLVEHPTPTHARQYKRAVASFLKKSQKLAKQVKEITAQRKFGVSEALSSRQKDSQASDPNTKKHVIVNTIDEKMDEITRSVMENEKEKIDLAENVEEIRGLIVDLVSSIRGNR